MPCQLDSPAIVEYDGAVGPAVVVNQAQVGEDAHAHSLQASLIAESKPVAVDLPEEETKGPSGTPTRRRPPSGEGA